jgi:hypothetical protein
MTRWQLAVVVAMVTFTVLVSFAVVVFDRFDRRTR